MKKYNLNQFTRGWFAGSFSPTLIDTKDFELGIKYYKLGDYEKSHAHNMSDEITIVVAGKIKMNEVIYNVGDIIVQEKGEFTDFYCLSKKAITVIVRPNGSYPNDKVFKK